MKLSGMILLTAAALASQTALGASGRAQTRSVAPVTTVSVEEFNAMRNDLATLAERVETLAIENAKLRESQKDSEHAVAEVKEAQKASSWSERIKVKGDFRYRYQNDSVDLANRSDRNRQRVRARPAIIATLPSDVEVGFGLATGSDDPVSTNQTLGGAGSSKGINLDLAYFDWQAIDGLHLVGGKFKNEFVRAGGNGLLWDSDWRPEGFQVLYEQGMFFANGLANWMAADNSRGGGESLTWGVQTGVNVPAGPAKIKAGLSYYDIPTKGRSCFFEADDCFGNTGIADPGNPGDFLYAFDYKEIEGFAEVAFKAFGLPSQLFANYVKNDAASGNDTGYAVGAKLGKAKKQGSWEIGYLYEDLEADAVLGLLTDSDFAGGGTDSKGHKVSGGYAFTDASKVKLTYFMTERQDSNGVENGGQPYDVDTLQLDFSWKYK